MNTAKICTKCIMPDTFPGIDFDDTGVCKFCRGEQSAEPVDWEQKRKELEKRIEAIKQEATGYHAIVPWSGGKDSSYVLYVMKKVYGLKVLAVNFDNGLKSIQAYKNIDTLSQTLEVDVITVRPDVKLMFDLDTHYLKEKGELCSICNVVGYIMLNSFIMNYCASLGYLPLVVGGWSGTHENIRDIFTFDYGELKKVLRKDPELLTRFENNILVNPNVLQLMQNAGDPRESSAVSAEIDFKFFHLPEYLEWNVVKIKKILEKEVKWSAATAIGAHEDCAWHNCMKYLMKTKFGIDNDTIAIAAMVRSGGISREEGLEMVRDSKSEIEPPEMDEILQRLGCRKEEINFNADWYSGDNVKA